MLVTVKCIIISYRTIILIIVLYIFSNNIQAAIFLVKLVSKKSNVLEMETKSLSQEFY